MENKINIAELLKYCPKGTKLYSPLCGECYFDRLNMGTIICEKQNTQDITFTSEGYYMLPVFNDCECMIFPSKDQRDWSKFQRPFKDGDIVATQNGIWIGIHKRMVGNAHEVYFAINHDCLIYNDNIFCFERLATEEEKQKLFNAIKKHGYKWNEETKTLEKLIEPKFKVGDIIQDIDSYKVKITEVNIEDECYGYESMIAKGIGSISFREQDDWELVPNKFDITTLKPFDKVLVRNKSNEVWTANFYSHYDATSDKPFICVGWSEMNEYRYCIPYEVNNELLGTTNNTEEYGSR